MRYHLHILYAGMLIGASGAKLLSLPVTRRAAKEVIKGGLAFRDWVGKQVATAREDLEDLVEEAKSEYSEEENVPPPATGPQKSPGE